MTRVAWLTDIHLDCMDPPEAQDFLERVAALDVESVLIGGDIADANKLEGALQQIDAVLQRPVYFVLGNHDFYFSSIDAVRRRVRTLRGTLNRLHYLTDCAAFELAPGVGLLGHDGWADARLGDFERSLVRMMDYDLIQDLNGADKQTRATLLMQLGDAAAEDVKPRLEAALDRFSQLVFLTHVPPFAGACWHEGQISDDQWMPHFTCKALGDLLEASMHAHPRCSMTVLCGHTHGRGEVRILPNLKCLTGHAVYGEPEVQQVFDFS
jgi:predicted phosphohydrolase